METSRDYRRLRTNVVDITSTLVTYLESDGFGERAAGIRKAVDACNRGKLFVLMVGEFKQGKSSLINALLGVRNVVPVDQDVTTNTAIEIEYSETFSCRVHMINDSGDEVIRDVSNADLHHYTTEYGNPKNKKRVFRVQIGCPSKLLKDGMVLVDTPGTGGLVKAHADVTIGYIPNADVYVYVSDVTQPLKKVDLDFLEQYIWPHKRPILHLLTKTDLVSANEIAIMKGDLQTKILNRNPACSTVPIPVSSQLKFDYLRSQNQHDYTESGFDIFENTLWKAVMQRSGALLLSRLSSNALQQLEEVAAYYQEQHKVLQNAGSIVDVDKTIYENRERLSRQNDIIQTFRQRSQDAVNDARSIIQREVPRVFAQSQLTLDSYLATITISEDNIQAIQEMIGLEVQNTVERANNLIREANDDFESNLLTYVRANVHQKYHFVIETVSTDIGDDFNLYHLNSVPTGDESRTQNIRNLSRCMLQPLAGVILGVVSLNFWMPIASIVTGWLTYKELCDNTITRAESQQIRLRNEILKKVYAAIRALQDSTVDQAYLNLTTAERRIRDDVQLELRNQAEMLTKSIWDLEQSKRMTIETSVRKRQEVESKMRRYSEIKAALASLSRHIAACSTDVNEHVQQISREQSKAQGKPSTDGRTTDDGATSTDTKYKQSDSKMKSNETRTRSHSADELSANVIGTRDSTLTDIPERRLTNPAKSEISSSDNQTFPVGHPGYRPE